MTFSSIHITIPFPLDQHLSCFTIIDSHFTVSDFIQKTLNQIYPNFNLNPNEYGIYVLPQGKWLFSKCMLSDYIEYVSPLQIEQFQLRPKKLISITVSCLQYKSTIFCDPNQPIGMLSKRAAEIFLQQENNSNSVLFLPSSKTIRISQSQIQNISLMLDSSQLPSLNSGSDTQKEKFFEWDCWSIWYKHRFIPDDTPCSMLHFSNVHMRRETKAQTKPIYTLFRTSLKETLLRELDIEKKRKEHKKEKKHSKMSENNEIIIESSSTESPAEVIKIKTTHTSPLGPNSLVPLNLTRVLTSQKSPRSRSPRSPRSSRSGHSSHSSRHDSDDILDSFFDKIENHIPIFLEYIFQKIESNPKVEGIFRKSGLQVTIDAFIEKVDSMFQTIFSESSQSSNHNSSAFKEELKSLIEAQQPHDIIGVLKSYFRVLPESLIPKIFYDLIFEASSISDPEKRLPIYRCIINSMPAANYAVLKRLSKCLNIVINYSDENKMNLMNIIICLFPALIKNRTDVDQLILLSQSKVQSTIGYDLFEKRHANFLYSRKNRKGVEIPSNIVKCVEKIDNNDQIHVGKTYILLKDDKPDKYTISIDNNRQVDVPLGSFERDPSIKLSHFSNWKVIDQDDDVNFEYLPILSQDVAPGVNAEVKYQQKRLKTAGEKLQNDINELTEILNSLSNNEEVNKDDIRKKLQEMSVIEDYWY
ncbi:hypothetical protein M9Y10_008339 [Tritrichomonas musculus]|uniref:Rho-GAP domain-containing protein n=1 Tax=Tritrichomonas musculus TaxID=1915356 RepID=A0ABR2IZN0_9EUKA